MRSLILRPSAMGIMTGNAGIGLLAVTGLSVASLGGMAVFPAVTIAVVALAAMAVSVWWMRTLRWKITETQIVYERGILGRKKDYMELYRVVDYRERQSFLQRICGVKDVVVMSQDRTHPCLVMRGIEREVDVIGTLRDRVEITKKRRNIYEITNR